MDNANINEQLIGKIEDLKNRIPGIVSDNLLADIDVKYISEAIVTKKDDGSYQVKIGDDSFYAFNFSDDNIQVEYSEVNQQGEEVNRQKRQKFLAPKGNEWELTCFDSNLDIDANIKLGAEDITSYVSVFNNQYLVSSEDTIYKTISQQGEVKEACEQKLCDKKLEVERTYYAEYQAGVKIADRQIMASEVKEQPAMEFGKAA